MKTTDNIKQGQMYWGSMPVPGRILGTVRRNTGATGALIRTRLGLYAQGNAGALRSLNQREAVQAINDSQ